MRPTRRGLMAGLAVAALPAMAFAADPELDRLIARHVAARGGARALDAVKRVRLALEITERGQTVRGLYHADVVRLARIDITVEGKRVFSEGVDGQGAWAWPGGAAEPRASTTPGAAQALLNSVEINAVGLHRYAERGHRLKLMPPETVDGAPHPVVECAFASGLTSYFYFDPNSWMIARRRDSRAYHPDLDQTKARVETRFSEFTKVGGVVASHRSDDFDLDKGTLLSTARVLKRELNPQLPAGLFDRGYRG
jgi:hypothetical protein